MHFSNKQAERIQTEQERFWSGEFGDEYTERNAIHPEQRAPFFQQVLNLTSQVQSICELGANRGHNMLALQSINPALSLTGVELNPTAFQELSGHSDVQAISAAIQDFEPTQAFDFVFTCGVLIHLNPLDLPAVYQKMAALSRRYILINEYYNPMPVEVPYRGHAGKLFKRDFGGELMDYLNGNYIKGSEGNTPDVHRVRLVDYGFLWQRAQPAWDNTTWWLFEKQT